MLVFVETEKPKIRVPEDLVGAHSLAHRTAVVLLCSDMVEGARELWIFFYKGTVPFIKVLSF